MERKGASAGATQERERAPLDKVYSDIEAYYASRVVKHGATPLGVDWSCQATQWLRFVQLLKICDFTAPFSLNDIGCGYGALAAFLANRHPETDVDYLGVDLSSAMIRRARTAHSAPNRRFVVGRNSPRIADYSVASGVMNVQLGYSQEHWEQFVAATLTEMRRASRRAFSVNFVSQAKPGRLSPDGLPDGLYRTDPESWTDFCERELGCSVATVDNYGMREFTLLARCPTEAAN